MTRDAALVLIIVAALAAGVASAFQNDASADARIMVVENVTYTRVGDDGGRALTLTAAFPRNPGPDPLPVVVYLHGGRWSAGAKEDGRAVTELFARGGYFAVTVDYRLAGEAKFPAAMHDVRSAIRFLRRHAEPLGIDPERIGVWGHTAGGHLATLVALSANTVTGDPERDASIISSRVRCVVNVAGPGDLDRQDFNDAGRAVIANWLGFVEGPRYYRALARLASPVTHADDDDPPVLIVHGADDPLIPVAHAKSFHGRLLGAGVASELAVLPGVEHHVPDEMALPRVAAFLDRHLGGEAAPHAPLASD